jgi:L-amino acid N-acyltransferase YncA
MRIRQATPADLDAMWRIFEAAIAAGDALLFAEGFTRETFASHWFGAHQARGAHVATTLPQPTVGN